jgi:RNA polymerase sigma-70 factor, ECF subfamily
MGTLKERLARGDHAAFAELYDAFADRVHHYLVVHLRSRADADDALQETFLRLARSSKTLGNVENLEAYVFAIARNEFLRLAATRARHRREHCTLTGEDLFRVTSAGPDAHDAADAVAAALMELSVELREVIDLKMYGGLTIQQISQVTGLPPGTVATRYRLALEKLRIWFARES